MVSPPPVGVEDDGSGLGLAAAALGALLDGEGERALGGVLAGLLGVGRGDHEGRDGGEEELGHVD